MAEKQEKQSLVYKIPDYPPVHLCIFFSFQQMVFTVSSIMVLPILTTQFLEAGHEDDEQYKTELLQLRAQLVGITVFCCGISTVLQCTFGIRLPMIQGSSYTFIPVIRTILSLSKFQPEKPAEVNITQVNVTYPPQPKMWQLQLSELSGSLMAASALQIFLGAAGLVGLLAKYVGPLTLTPILSLIALGMIDSLAANSSHQWGIAAMCALLVIVFSEFVVCKIPIPTWSRKKGCYSTKLPIFQLLPVFFTIVVTWSFSAILTATNVFPNNRTHSNYQARTDAKIHIVQNSDWISLPYPGRWGTPTISLASFLGMLIVTFSSIAESVGDYYAAAAICDVPQPPAHAVNRGMLIEGLGSLVGGALYAGHGFTSYSGNIGSIGISRVGSRIVFQLCGVLMVLLGLFGKFGAAIATIPEPILAGLLLMLISLLFGVAMGYLHNVNMNKSRNLTVLGLSIMAGVVVPRWVRLPENANIFNTGSSEFNSVLKIILGTEIILGGTLAFLLDIVLPGTRKDRGLESWHENEATHGTMNKYSEDKIYGFWSCCKYPGVCRFLPFMPPFLRGQNSEAEKMVEFIQNGKVNTLSKNVKMSSDTNVTAL